MNRVAGLLIFLFLFQFSLLQELGKVLTDLRSGDIKRFERHIPKDLFRNVKHFRDNLKVVVVVYGNGYRFFIKNLESPLQGGQG